MLSNNGILTFIISDRFLRDKNIKVFQVFNSYLKDMERISKDSVFIQRSAEFKSDEGVIKEQETSFGMVIIRLKKLENYTIALDSQKRVSNVVDKNEDIDDDIKDEIIKKSKSVLKTRSKTLKDPDEEKPKKPKKVKETIPKQIEPKIPTQTDDEALMDYINSFERPKEDKPKETEPENDGFIVDKSNSDDVSF